MLAAQPWQPPRRLVAVIVMLRSNGVHPPFGAVSFDGFFMFLLKVLGTLPHLVSVYQHTALQLLEKQKYPLQPPSVQVCAKQQNIISHFLSKMKL